jgi:hypothetical protein
MVLLFFAPASCEFITSSTYNVLRSRIIEFDVVRFASRPSARPFCLMRTTGVHWTLAACV